MRLRNSNKTMLIQVTASGYASLRDYVLQHAERSRLIQLLIENEISRLTIWSNPVAGKGGPVGRTIELSVTVVS